jgi:beta-phosphoglucomutase
MSTVPSLVIVDIDGTLLDTPHLSAWRRGLAAVLGRDRPADPVEDTRLLSLASYQRHIAGRPREVGARAALEQAGAEPGPDLVALLVRRKQDEFRALMASTALFADAERFLLRAADRGVPLAFCTASRNAGGLLRRLVAAGHHGDRLVERLDRSLGPLGHRGDLPRPDALRAVAAVWASEPGECLVIDDAPHGVDAAEAAGMDAVLIDRFGHAPRTSAGHRTVTSLDDVDHRLAATTSL